jgi:hypothetical protein
LPLPARKSKTAGDFPGSTALGRTGDGSYLSPEYLGSFATAPGLVSLLMFLLFAAMPMIGARAGSEWRE